VCAAAPAGLTYLRPPCSHGPPPQREPRSATTTKQPCEDHAANRAAARGGIRQAGAASAHLRLGGGAAMPRVESACAGPPCYCGAKSENEAPGAGDAERPTLRTPPAPTQETAACHRAGWGKQRTGRCPARCAGRGKQHSAQALPDSATGSISCASAVRGDTTGCPVAKVAAGVPRAAQLDTSEASAANLQCATSTPPTRSCCHQQQQRQRRGRDGARRRHSTVASAL
jgi:hypothetical protein